MIPFFTLLLLRLVGAHLTSLQVCGAFFFIYLISFIQDPEHVHPWQLRGAGMTERKRVAELCRLVKYYNLPRINGL